ncbi:MAG: type IV pilus twitching motility protein PilT [Opitutales bacterium]
MRPDTHWLLHFCYDCELLTKEQLAGVIASADQSLTADALAKSLADAGWVTDRNFLEEAKQAAVQNVEQGHPLPELPGIAVEAESVPEVSNPVGLPDYGELEVLDEASLIKALEDLFQRCQEAGVSDLHLTGNARPRIRHHRKIIYLNAESLPDPLARRMNLCLLSKKQQEEFETDKDLDYALTLGSGEAGIQTRFRANLIEHKNGISGVYRIISKQVRSLEELGFPNPENIRKLLTYHNGIILVTGPAGAGKSTTLASLVNELNRERQEHIITVENPIEYMQDSDQSILTQREVGTHTSSYRVALKSALREDPDIIIVGEMRDLETIEMAITAAETGHLVIATMDTRDAYSTLTRILDVFPARQQNQIRTMVAGSLRGILCQRLLPSLSGGVALACELMINNNAVANIIRDGKETGLDSAMQTGRKQGMRTLNESLDALVEAGTISEQVADENRPHIEK